MLEPMHSLVTNCCVVDACVQVRAESPMEHSAQGKRSDTLGLPMLEQSRPERAKALLQCALDFYQKAIISKRYLKTLPLMGATRLASGKLQCSYTK